MTFRQSAAMSLSAILLGGNLLLPLTEASPVAISGHAPAYSQWVGQSLTAQKLSEQALSNMIRGPLQLAMAQQSISHPVHKAERGKQGVVEWLNPFGQFGAPKPAQPAKTTAIQPIRPMMKMAMPLVIANAPARPVKKLKVVSKPQVSANLVKNEVTPLIQVAAPMTLKESVSPSPASGADATAPTVVPQRIEPMETTVPVPQPAPRKVTYTQIFSPPAMVEPAPIAKPLIASADTASRKTVYKANPVFDSIYPTYDPHYESSGQPLQHKAAKAAEAFSMMATSALDQLVMQTRSSNLIYNPATPMMDTADTYNNNSNVKVLKSGISQKLTTVDLTIGKSEVIYLSRPASRVSVSNPDVATAVIISPSQIQLIGKAVGVANLMVWGDMVSPDHTVVDINVHKDVSVLVNQLRYVDPGIQIVPMAAEDTVILTGQAESRETAQLAVEMAKAFFSKNAIGAAQNNGPNSQAPGSAIPGVNTNVINLLKVKGEPSTKVELVRQRLHEVDPNIRLEVVPGPEGNEKVILTGRVPTASVAAKALNLASVFYGQPGMRMVTAQGGNDYTKLQIDNSSVTSSGSGGSGNSNNNNGQSGATTGANMLQGSVVTDATGNVISMLEIAQKPQIKCSIKFLELNKSSMNALGGTISGMSGNTGMASWSGVQSPAPGKPVSVLSTQDMSGSAFSNFANRAAAGSGSNLVQSRFNEVYQNGITQVLTINNQVAAAIQALQERRQVRTLAEPTLTLLSGEQGSFLAGGEIPIAFVGGQGQVTIQYKEFGIRLNILPNVTDDGKIQMQVAPEVSSLDQANGVSTNSVSVPAFMTRRMQTTLLVEPGQSFVLAGLYNQTDTDSMSRFPGLGSVPILGSFFRNSWNTRSKGEMVVVIRPEIIYSNTGGAALPSGPTGMLPQSGSATALSKK